MREMNLDILVERAKIVSAIRHFFDGQGFVEVETAVRIDAPAPEEHIDCPVVLGGTSRGEISPNPSDGRDVSYLRASPELQMKKLLAAGMDKIYQIGPCFREGERGSRHNPEFTMIEWYRRKADYRDIAEDLRSLVLRLMSSSGRQDFRRETEDAERSFQTLRVRDAYLRYAGWDPWAGDWDQDRFDFDMATKIEPAIKELGGGVFLMDYPPQAASLAKISMAEGLETGDARRKFAERWEFYWDGMELANCFTELCDRDEQRRRFEKAKEARKLLKEADYPIDDGFIDCLPKIESAAGVALGVDRLVMVLTKAKEISAVRAQL